MYIYVQNEVADCVNDLFTISNEIHNRVIRQSDTFYIPLSRLSAEYKSMCFKGPLMWNSIRDQIRYKKVFVNSYIISLMMSDCLVCRFEAMDIIHIRMSNGLHNYTFVTPLSVKLLYVYN